jgi:hypothetical protein
MSNCPTCGGKYDKTKEQDGGHGRYQWNFWHDYAESLLAEIARLRSERKELAFEAFNAGRQRGTCEVVCKNWAYDVQEDEPDFEKWWEKKNEKAESKS